MHVTVVANSPGLDYANAELRRFLERFSNALFEGDGEPDLAVRLQLSPELRPHQYRLQGQAGSLAITGGSASAVLCAVYDALGRAGVHFDIGGQWRTAPLDCGALTGLDETVTPRFCRRGVRQHINFPMDISSYPLAEAQEYVRNLARLRCNAITLHSYRGQWHGSAGNFFYGQRHAVPQVPSLAGAVRNRRWLCIPEVEPVLDDPERRGLLAKDWLRAVIRTAKEASIEVTLSIELDGYPEGELQAMARSACKDYPQIDVLEFISSEGGGSAEGYTIEDVQARAEALFGEQGQLGELPRALPPALPGSLEFLRRALTLCQTRADWQEGLTARPSLRVGLYVMDRDTLRLARPLMARILPAEVTRSFLPAHGAVTAAANIAYMQPDADDWRNTMYYTWAEFDGNMYLQQLGADGIHALTCMPETEEAYGVCFNHWRTAENRTTIAYAARALIDPVPPATFYRDYAAALGIGDADAFAVSLARLAALDTYNRDHLFNVGFCYLGCWLNPKGLGWTRSWEISSVDHAIAEYGAVRAGLERLLAVTGGQEGVAFLRASLCRLRCSHLHLEAVRALLEIGTLVSDEHPEQLTPAQQRLVEEACDRAQEKARQYMACHVEQMPDRGCEGTLVSYAATIPVYIDHIHQYFVGGEKSCSHLPSSWDSPPPPAASTA